MASEVTEAKPISIHNFRGHWGQQNFCNLKSAFMASEVNEAKEDFTEVLVRKLERIWLPPAGPRRYQTDNGRGFWVTEWYLFAIAFSQCLFTFNTYKMYLLLQCLFRALKKGPLLMLLRPFYEIYIHRTRMEQEDTCVMFGLRGSSSICATSCSSLFYKVQRIL